MLREIPAGVVTLVFTDVEESSRLSERYRSDFEPARQIHFRLLRETADRWNGVEISTAGDSLFLVFDRPSDAVQWAVEAQRALQQQEWPQPAVALHDGVPLQIRVRIGMHTGEPFASPDPERPNFYGPPVNRAARIMDAGHGGQILLSNATREVAQQERLGNIHFRDCGNHRLRGVGEEHLWQILHPDLPETFAALRALNPERHNLPLPPTPFVGREADIAEWMERLRLPTTRLMTLTGLGGLGKTRAALHLAELCVAQFSGGVYWVELEEAKTTDELLRRIAEQFGASLPPGPTLKEQVHAYLRQRRMLLVLDNIEQVRDAANVVRDLLNAAPEVKCLITSRRALELRAEVVAEMHPLLDADAERLFIERARACSADFRLTEENAADVQELCRRLEGIPLAIELAAARVVGMAPRQMIARLSERFRLLQTRAPDLPPRLRALRAAIDWSYCLLSDEDKALFAQMAVFAGGFTMEDAEAVCEAFDVFEGVMELRRSSLFRAETDPQTQETRFILLDSLREYAAERLEERDDQGEALRRRHAEYFLGFARKRLGRFRTPDEVTALRQLEASSGNVRVAMEWAQQAGPPQLFAELALYLGIMLLRHGFHTQAKIPLQVGLEAVEPIQKTHPRLTAQLLQETAGLIVMQPGALMQYLDQNELAEAQEKAQRALAISQETDDIEGQAISENLLGLIAAFNGAYDMARTHYTWALTHAVETKDAILTAIVHNNLGIVERRDKDGSREEAAYHFQEALNLRRARDDRRGVAETLNNLGVLAFEAENWETAWKYYAEALEHERALSHPFGVAMVLQNLGETAEQRGELVHACRLFAAAERLMEEVKSPLVSYVLGYFTRVSALADVPEAKPEVLRRAVKNRSLDDLIAWAMRPI